MVSFWREKTEFFEQIQAGLVVWMYHRSDRSCFEDTESDIYQKLSRFSPKALPPIFPGNQHPDLPVSPFSIFQ